MDARPYGIPGDGTGFSGFWARALAYILDAWIFKLLSLPFIFVFCAALAPFIICGWVMVLRHARTLEPDVQFPFAMMVPVLIVFAAIIVVVVLSFLLQCCYAGYFLRRFGATPGKMILDLKVVDLASQSNPSFKQGFLRELAKLLSSITLCIGFMMAGWTKEKTALHDLLCSTRVVKGVGTRLKAAPDAASPKQA